MENRIPCTKNMAKIAKPKGIKLVLLLLTPYDPLKIKRVPIYSTIISEVELNALEAICSMFLT